MIKMNMSDCIKTYTYVSTEGFYVDLIDNKLEKKYEAWIYHKDYGIKELMFGVPEEQQTWNEFRELVWAGFEKDKEIYINNYMEVY